MGPAHWCQTGKDCLACALFPSVLSTHVVLDLMLFGPCVELNLFVNPTENYPPPPKGGLWFGFGFQLVWFGLVLAELPQSWLGTGSREFRAEGRQEQDLCLQSCCVSCSGSYTGKWSKQGRFVK